MIRVLLAEDAHMVRGALAALLGLEEDIGVVAQVDNGTDIVAAASRTEPDVAVIDVNLPGLDGISAAGEMHEKVPGCRTLILTSLARPGTLQRALVAGVAGYMLKDAPPEELAAAIRRVAAGEQVVDHQLALAALSRATCPLTARELEVLRLASEGSEVTEIAERLFLSIGTVRNYLTAILSKLNARNRVDAIRIAGQAGWL